MTQTGLVLKKNNRKCPSAGTCHFNHMQFSHCPKQRSHYVALNRGKSGKGSFLPAKHIKAEISTGDRARQQGDQVKSRKQSGWLEMLGN